GDRLAARVDQPGGDRLVLRPRWHETPAQAVNHPLAVRPLPDHRQPLHRRRVPARLELEALGHRVEGLAQARDRTVEGVTTAHARTLAGCLSAACRKARPRLPSPAADPRSALAPRCNAGTRAP